MKIKDLLKLDPELKIMIGLPPEADECGEVNSNIKLFNLKEVGNSVATKNEIRLYPCS